MSRSEDILNALAPLPTWSGTMPDSVTFTSTSGKSSTVCRLDLLPEYHRMMLDEVEKLRSQVGILKACRGLDLAVDATDEDAKRIRAEMGKWLVMIAYKHVEITISRAAELLGMDIVSCREMMAAELKLQELEKEPPLPD